VLKSFKILEQKLRGELGGCGSNIPQLVASLQSKLPPV
jgi:hypothetical protein